MLTHVSHTFSEHLRSILNKKTKKTKEKSKKKEIFHPQGKTKVDENN